MKKVRNNKIFIGIIILIIIFIILFFFNKFIDNFESEKQIKLNIQTVLIIKENIPFLREWIIYHLNLGFDKIYLYDNTGSVGIDGSSKENNKYNFKFDEIIKLNDIENEKELQNIINDFKEHIVYVKWQPKNKDGKIIYGQNESIIDYINKLVPDEYVTYTAYTDVDEFIFSPSNINLKQFIKEKYQNDVNKIIITQKKFIDRFCAGPKKIINMVNTIENINTNEWAYKNIINNSAIDVNNISTIHEIGIKSGKIEKLSQDILRFNHYNINFKQKEWMKNYYKKDTFESGVDNSMSRYKTIIDEKCGNKCSDNNNLINYDKIDNNNLCYTF
jgi:hypothetical protein